MVPPGFQSIMPTRQRLREDGKQLYQNTPYAVPRLTPTSPSSVGKAGALFTAKGVIERLAWWCLKSAADIKLRRADELSTLIVTGITGPQDRGAIEAWVDGNADRDCAHHRLWL